MDKLFFKSATYTDDQGAFSTRSAFGKGHLEIEQFFGDNANYKITIKTQTAWVSVICEDLEIDTESVKGVRSVLMYYKGKIQGAIYLFNTTIK